MKTGERRFQIFIELFEEKRRLEDFLKVLNETKDVMTIAFPPNEETILHISCGKKVIGNDVKSLKS
jgi:hypothetical protein